MKDGYIRIRISSELKKQFKQVLKNKTMSEAIEDFIKEVITAYPKETTK